MLKLAWNYILVHFCGLFGSNPAWPNQESIWMQSVGDRDLKIRASQIWQRRQWAFPFHIYIEFLGFGELFHGNVPICTNFYCHSCFMMRATHAGNLKSQLKKASRRFCSSNLGNCNYICFLGGEWGGLMCPKDTISPLIFSPSLGRSDSIQRRTN